ncbi:MAG: aminoacetone oxidase family FAD-binding enzyme, partial [Bacteroidales bacterium]|nr:aminoacetone oxidase family FAD-binding enzyme [Bacteroidales bacterium]
GIYSESGMVTGVSRSVNDKIVNEGCRSLIIATGGLSYPLTGSEGDGYAFAKSLGHTVKELFPSLTALVPKNYDSRLSGLLLKNVAVTLLVAGKELQYENGEVEFTSAGIEGALGFRVSRKAVRAMINGEKVSLVLDLKPALTENQIVKRAEREYAAGNCKNIRELLALLLPSDLVKSFEEYAGLKSAASPKDQEQIKRMATMLKCWKFDIEGYVSWERAVITAGGVSSDGIIAKNMRSKLYKNLFFAGEVLDLDGDTGGYNLQIAFSTGYLAGREAAYLIKSSTGEPEI